MKVHNYMKGSKMAKSIRTNYATTPNGKGRIIVRYGNLKRSYPYLHGLSVERNHEEAAYKFANEYNSEIRAMNLGDFLIPAMRPTLKGNIRHW
jgi:hypothetical protein